MKCKHKFCSKILVGKQKKFCSRKCQNIFNNGNTLKTRSTTVIGNTCKWCMGSEEGFCCEKHKGLYENFKKAIDSELSKRKPKPTKEQLKGYAKIESIIVNKSIQG